MAQSSVKFEFKGDSKDLQKAVSKAKKDLGGLENQAGSTSSSLDKLGGASTAAAGTLGPLAAAGATVVAALGALAAAGAKAVSSLTKLTAKLGRSEAKIRGYARAVGVSRENLQALADITRVMGGDVQDVVDIFANANDEFVEMGKGGGRLQKVLKGTKADLDQIANSKNVISFIKNLEKETRGLSKATRTAALQKVLGEEGIRQLGGGIRKIQELENRIKKLKNLGVILPDQASANLAKTGRAVKNVKNAFRGLKKVIASALAPSISLLSKVLVKVMESFINGGKGSQAFSRALFKTTKKAIPAFVSGINIMIKSYNTLISVTQGFILAGELVVETLAALGRGFAAVGDVVVEGTKILHEFMKLGIKRLIQVVKELLGVLADVADKIPGSFGEGLKEAEKKLEDFADTADIDLGDQIKRSGESIGEKFGDILSDTVDFSTVAWSLEDAKVENVDQFVKEIRKKIENGLGDMSFEEFQAELSKEGFTLTSPSTSPSAGDDGHRDISAPTEAQIKAQKRLNKAKKTETKIDDLLAKKAKVKADFKKRETKLEKKIKEAKKGSKEEEKLKRKLRMKQAKLAGKILGIEQQITDEKEEQRKNLREREQDLRVQQIGAVGGTAGNIGKTIKSLNNTNERLSRDIENLSAKIEETEDPEKEKKLTQKKRNKELEKNTNELSALVKLARLVIDVTKKRMDRGMSIIRDVRTVTSSLGDARRRKRKRKSPGLTGMEKLQNTVDDSKKMMTMVATMGAPLGLAVGSLAIAADKKKRKRKEKKKRQNLRFRRKQAELGLRAAKAQTSMQKKLIEHQKRVRAINRKIKKGQIDKEIGQTQIKILKQQLQEFKEMKAFQLDQAEATGKILDAQLAGNDFLAIKLGYDKREDQIREDYTIHPPIPGSYGPGALTPRGQQAIDNLNKREKLALRQISKNPLSDSETRKKFGREIGREAGRQMERAFQDVIERITVADPTESSLSGEVGKEEASDFHQQQKRLNNQSQ